MNEQEWLTSTDPAAMLEWLISSTNTIDALPGRRPRREWVTDRKLRLFACACERHFNIYCEDAERKRLVYAKCDAFEDHCDGKATLEQTVLARYGTTENIRWRNMDDAQALAQEWADPGIGDYPGEQQPANTVIAALLREIFGNPFRLVNPTDDDLADWQIHRVSCGGGPYAIAQAIYDERAFDRMPVLADALEEAGCREAVIISHCRGFAPHPIESGSIPNYEAMHVRGCWVVDLVLGKA